MANLASLLLLVPVMGVWITSDPDTTPAVVAGSLAVIGILTIVGIHSLFVGWFLLHRYQLIGTTLEEVDPVFGTRRTIDLANLREVRDFKVLGYRSITMRTAHVLIGVDGGYVKVTEALPIWTEVEAFLGAIPVRPQVLWARWVF